MFVGNLTTNACQTEIGAWLGQKDASREIQPFICTLKKFFKTQQRWYYKTEIVWINVEHAAISQIYVVVCLLCIDHKPLVHLVTNQLSVIMQE